MVKMFVDEKKKNENVRKINLTQLVDAEKNKKKEKVLHILLIVAIVTVPLSTSSWSFHYI